MKIESVDLFCGIGGLTYGLQKSGINVIAGVDNDKTCKFAYERNNKAPFINADIKQFNSEKIKKLYSKDAAKVLVGCAPCQPFSSHTYKNKSKSCDSRWDLLTYFGKIINETLPDVISMENVRGIVKTDIFKMFLSVLEKNNYHVDYKIVYIPDYGAPQNRSRLILLASKLGEIQIPKPTHTKDKYITVRDVIKNLQPIKAGQVSKNDSLHKAKNLLDINLQRIKQSKPNGTWRDWDRKLLPTCYRKESGQTYSSVYGRMDWDRVSPTITTQFFNYGSGRFGHPTQNRALSLREGALLQTFPEDYDFGEVKNMTTISRHIGNAVPPVLGEVIGRTIKKHLSKYYGRTK
ncbi:MAG: DNA (cytosine-5-)-methyltransferase [Candidatus Pacebacteria bacterium]|nr:DNA (cytosine-5-)-methyltransferase [Candidatus Paceibacterota bacterium]